MEKLYALRPLRLYVLLAILIWGSKSLSQTNTPRSITVDNNCHGFYEYLPVNYSSGSSFPLIIFIHGIGEVGNGTTDLAKVQANGPPQLIKANNFPASFTVNGKSYSFIVLSPQFVAWPSASDINDIYNYALAHYKVDINRVYITGLSMGGGATWTFASNSTAFASKIAALLPVCGAATLSQANADNIASTNLPVWATHNNGDGTVSVQNTLTNISEIDSHKPTPNPAAKSSIFNATGHNAWSKTYDPLWRDSGYNVYEWMLKFQRNLTGGNQLPVANAGADQSITLPTNSITLNGSASNDPDGTISTFKWSELSGPTQYTVANASAATTSVTNLVQGTYVFRITVTDNKGGTATDDVTINVSSGTTNQLPVANAGPDQNITLPTNSATLNGGASKDPDGTIVSYKWTEISGPTQYTISSATVVSPVLTNLVHGAYKFRLTVTDNKGATGSADLTINVAVSTTNQSPVANAGPDQTIILPLNAVTLNGGASKDPDGTIASYKWTEISGPTQYTISSATIVTPGLTNLMHGAYVFRLTVTDNNGATATDDVTINVAVATQGNMTPVANAGTNTTITLPVNSVQLDGTASKDPDGTITKYSWIKVGGGSYTINNAALASPVVSSLAVGTYVFQLTVTDNVGATGSASVTITVKSPSIIVTSLRTRVLIDAGPASSPTASPDGSGKYWNNMTDGRPGVRVSNAVDTANHATNVSLQVINRIDGTYAVDYPGTNGGNSTGAVGDYPATATNDYIFAHNSTTTGRWRLFGLDASKTYTVKFWGSKTGGDRVIQIKRTDQTAWQQYNALNNTDYNRAAVFTVTGLTEVSFDIQVVSGTYGYINVIDIVGIDNSAVNARSANTEIQATPTELNVTEHISMYPNPATDNAQLVIRSNYQGPVKVVMLSSGGVLIKEYSITKSVPEMLQNIQLSNLASGVYYLRVQLGKDMKVVKFIKK